MPASDKGRDGRVVQAFINLFNDDTKLLHKLACCKGAVKWFEDSNNFEGEKLLESLFTYIGNKDLKEPAPRAKRCAIILAEVDKHFLGTLSGRGSALPLKTSEVLVPFVHDGLLLHNAWSRKRKTKLEHQRRMQGIPTPLKQRKLDDGSGDDVVVSNKMSQLRM